MFSFTVANRVDGGGGGTRKHVTVDSIRGREPWGNCVVIDKQA